VEQQTIANAIKVNTVPKLNPVMLQIHFAVPFIT